MYPVLRINGDNYYIDNVLLGAGYRIITNGQKTIITHPNGKTEHYFNNVLHCDDGPAVIFQHNVYAFYGHDDYIIRGHVHMHMHREYADEKYDKPRATVYYNHGKIHNANGPAIVNESGCSYWINDKLHRIGGPAVINKYHGIRYYIDGLLSNTMRD